MFILNYLWRPARAISSVSLEHLVYTEGVGSSSLSSPTLKVKKPALKSRLFLCLRAGLDAQSEVSRPCLGDTNSRIVSVRCSNVIFQVFEISNSSVFGMLSKWPLLPNPSGHSSMEYEHLATPFVMSMVHSIFSSQSEPEYELCLLKITS